MKQVIDNNVGMVYGGGGTPLYYPAGKVNIGITYIRKPKVYHGQSENIIQEVVFYQRKGLVQRVLEKLGML